MVVYRLEEIHVVDSCSIAMAMAIEIGRWMSGIWETEPTREDDTPRSRIRLM
jgi:hypothetical protein